jgi:hypothetical protein
MGGGLLQLVIKGSQDEFLTGNPTMTFFKKVYKRHTNFAIEQMEQNFLGQVKFGKRLRCKIGRKGDLLSNMYLGFELTDGPGNNYYDKQVNLIKPGFKIIEYVEIEIGGQAIDRHYGEWMDIWTQLHYTKEKYDMLMGLIKNPDTNFTNNTGKMIYVPLMFWFNIEPGLALPLISLQFHEIVLYVKLREKEEMMIINNTNFLKGNDNAWLYRYNKLPNSEGKNNFFDVKNENTIGNYKWELKAFTGEIRCAFLYVDYIFLDVEEKKLFANNNHEYLITQIQTSNKLGLDALTSTDTKKNKQIQLDFAHPIKEIVWTLNSKHLDNTFIYKNMDLSNIISEALLQLNGQDRLEKREGTFYSCIQPYQFHKSGGLLEIGSKMYYNGGFYIYSFCLKPDEYQPSSALNFTSLNNFTINFDYTKTSTDYTTIDEEYTFASYAVSYNILQISKGMAKLVYSS